MKINFKKRGQNTAEYAIIIALVIGAVMAMQTYTKRGLQARQYDATNEYVGSLQSTFSAHDAELGSNPNAVMAAGGQYEPEELRSHMTESTVGEARDTVRLDKEGRGSQSSNRVTTGESGDYQNYEYNGPVSN